VGMVCLIILLIRSWGSSANGLMTFNGVWHRVKEDAAAKFMVISFIFYGAATMEGSIMADKTVISLSQYTEWTVAHVHSGSLGWVAMITIGSLYAIDRKSTRLNSSHVSISYAVFCLKKKKII